MKTYETTATVQDQGQVRLSGVPFAPGTEVEVTISPKARTAAGLRWNGNVLVHQGVGAMPPVNEVREERLQRLSEGRSG